MSVSDEYDCKQPFSLRLSVHTPSGISHWKLGNQHIKYIDFSLQRNALSSWSLPSKPIYKVNMKIRWENTWQKMETCFPLPLYEWIDFSRSLRLVYQDERICKLMMDGRVLVEAKMDDNQAYSWCTHTGPVHRSLLSCIWKQTLDPTLPFFLLFAQRIKFVQTWGLGSYFLILFLYKWNERT